MPVNSTTLGVVLVGFLLALKFALLLWLGPLASPDTAAYASYADEILRSDRWRTDVDLSTYAAPVPLFRMVGLPLLIAGTKSLAPDSWPWLFVSLQIFVSVLTSYRLFAVAARVSGNAPLAFLLALAHATSTAMFIGQMVLTDTVYVLLLTHITCTLVEIGVDRRVGFWRALSIAAAMPACFLLREASAMLCLLWLPLALVSFLRAVALRCAVPLALAVFVPLFATVGAYKAWNTARAGEPIVSTSYQLVLLYPLIKAYRYDPSIFGGPADFDRVSRDAVRHYGYDEAIAINRTMHARYKWDGIRLAREVEQRYWRAWRQNTLAMLRATLDRTRFADATILVQPVAALNSILSWAKIVEWNALSTTSLSRSVFVQGRVALLPILVLDIAGKAVSIAITLLLIAGAVAVLLRWQRLKSVPLAAEYLAMAAIVAAFYAAHAVVNIDHRYLMALVPVALIMASALFRFRDEFFGSSPSRAEESPR